MVSLLLLLVPAANAQQPDLVKPADTSSPRATLQSLIDSCNEFHSIVLRDQSFDRDAPEHRALARRAIDCVDQSQLPEFAREHAAAEAATTIKEILDRVELPPFEEIPDAEMIASMENGLDHWQVPGTRMTIMRVDEGPQKYEYLFSSGTVTRVVDHYQDLKGLPYRTSGPATSPGLRDWYLNAPANPRVGRLLQSLPAGLAKPIWGQSAWKWIALLISFVIALVLLYVVYRLQRYYAAQFRHDRPYLYALTIVFPILAVLIPNLLLYTGSEYAALRGDWMYRVEFFVNLMELCTSVVLVFSIANRISALIISSPRINPEGLDAQFIRILSKILGLVVSVMVFLEGGQYLGIPITTLLASAGVGGLAVALAAQDTLKNLFGTIMLMGDKPFRVGERIVTAGYDGVVEDIGLRSTRIRLLNGHQVTIPNDTLARSDIENVGRRKFIRRVANIRIPLYTPREKVKQAVELIRQALENHEGASNDYPPRVFFDEFNDGSFNIKMMYWYQPANYWDYLAFAERLNLEIMRTFEGQQIEFSLPTRISYATFDNREEPLLVKGVDHGHSN